MLGSPAGGGGPAHRGLWPVAPPPIQSATNFTPDGFYSFLPGSPPFGSALYSNSSAIGRLATATIQPTPGAAFHSAHKVTESLFASSGYTFGAPTPPPGSPYSPVPVTNLDLLTKAFNSNIILQHPDYPLTPKKLFADGPNSLCDETATCCKRTCCSCLPAKSTDSNAPSGCSRTNPVNWNLVSIKKEPGATPCQVAEVTTSGSPNMNASIKVEVTSPPQKTCVSNVYHEQLQHCGLGTLPSVVTSNGTIPVGIAVARQRKHQEVIPSPLLSPMRPHAGHSGLLTTISATHIKNVTSVSDLDADMGATSGTAGVVGGGTLLQCPPEERGGGGFAGWPVGGAHSSALTTPTLWQYPAHLPMEPLMPIPMPMPMPPVGFQVVRDHSTGGFFLLPTTSVADQVQQVMWPSYHQPSSHVFLPPTLPPPPLQLLTSSSEYLQSSTMLHQQTQSTRLLAVTTDKRKLPVPIPATTFIKIESELSQNKVHQTMSSFDNNTGTVYTDPNMGPLMTTHVIYQHPPNLILSQNPVHASEIHPTSTCRSLATSPVTCLTPPPESTPDEETCVQQSDASNQTESECEVQEDATACKEEVVNLSNCVPDISIQEQLVPNVPNVAVAIPEPATALLVQAQDAHAPKEEKLEEKIDESLKLIQFQPKQSLTGSTESLTPHKNEICTQVTADIKQECNEKFVTPDLSGLELLSNSIEAFENSRKIEPLPTSSTAKIPCCAKTNEEVLERIAQMTLSDKSYPADDELGGLDLLCALAEQRIMEAEEEVNSTVQLASHVKREHSKGEPARKGEKRKLDGEYEHEFETKSKHMNISDNQSDDKKRDNSIKSCTCREDSYRSYKTKESEEEAKKFLASRSQASCCNSDWPCMDAMELDMRIRLADLQRKYREKQHELSKLRPKRQEHRDRCKNKKKMRKKSMNSDRSTPPPQLDKIDDPVSHSNNNVGVELLKPPKLCAYGNQENVGTCPIRQIYSEYVETDLSCKSSKKRKVGRPKKLMSTTGVQSGTETIVAKKLKKGNLVGYLLAAKEKLVQNNSVYSDPPRFVDDAYKPRNKYPGVDTHIEINYASHGEDCDADVEDKSNVSECVYAADAMNGNEEELHSAGAVSQDAPADSVLSQSMKDIDGAEEVEAEQSTVTDCRCLLTTDHLEQPKLRVLTAMDGLFYAGRLNALQPPDVYSITLDGERGNRPHIMSREEILRDAIVEVSPTSTDELLPGTRLCAYWSQQYRCLYPGSAAEPEGPDTDSKFVSVDFDDGDNGRIAIEDIRLLPVDYPIIEYDPNPLLSLSKKRRRISTVEDRRASVVHKSPTPPPPIKEDEPEPETKLVECNQDLNKELQSYKERRRLKKKKRSKFKQKQHDERKKRKKHKYAEENVKHRKHHKKHHKHKKHHHKKGSHDDTASFVKKHAVKHLEAVEEFQVVLPETDADVDEVDVAMHQVDEVDAIPSSQDEVTLDDVLDAKTQKSKKFRDRQESCESRSKMSAFLPARQMWGWSGKGYKRPRTKGRSRKQFYRAIQRGKETIHVGDSAVFLSTGRPDRPYIGKIEAMWESCGTMVVKVKWFYHPEETEGCPLDLKYPGALFESPHVDENDVQTISHKCEVLPLKDYTDKLGDNPKRYASIYDNNDVYYLAGNYDPTTTTLKMEPDIPFGETSDD